MIVISKYKSAMRNIDLDDDKLVPNERRHITLPTLLVVSSQDYVCCPEIQKYGTQRWAKQLNVEELDCGNWVQLEEPDKLNGILEQFAEDLQS